MIRGFHHYDPSDVYSSRIYSNRLLYIGHILWFLSYLKGLPIPSSLAKLPSSSFCTQAETLQWWYVLAEVDLLRDGTKDRWGHREIEEKFEILSLHMTINFWEEYVWDLKKEQEMRMEEFICFKPSKYERDMLERYAIKKLGRSTRKVPKIWRMGQNWIWEDNIQKDRHF